MVSASTTGVNMYGAPVDLSFKNISSLADAWTEEPNSGLRPLKRNSEMKYPSCSLRLNNNSITDLHDLQQTVSHFLAEPSQLSWLDLSFNNILHIDKILCELRELRVLYLHGNSIFILSEVDRLGVLPHLHTITLHGNVIETNKAYRCRLSFKLNPNTITHTSLLSCKRFGCEILLLLSHCCVILYKN
ncbi:leucine-rich repeat-containing protein 51 isoform X2 [Cottoperca gobio]|uniref:Leucine-rich repeat-containing protein 51 n=1 Tax=Cottoperca gobio TaxID=56716 RepID=A0A6J2QUN1_COTGO|nr:leucine-rich repeat-containing protein 51-like isoform X2 [Cottoperca gobio]